MNKQAIIKALTEKYQSFTQFIDALKTEDYNFSYHDKWTAGQQLQHMVLCTKSLAKVFGMEHQIIAQNFGTTARAGRGSEILGQLYREQLKAGGKAPERFVPGPGEGDHGERTGSTLTALIADLCSGIETFTEQELDELLVPHPLLGPLSLREMLYNAITHVQHHHELTMQNLTHK